MPPVKFKKPIGKPRKYNSDGTPFILEAPKEIIEPDYIQLTKEDIMPQEAPSKGLGNFIVINTNTLNGLRINLDKLNSYAPNSETSIGLAWAAGIQSNLKFSTKEDMELTLARLDAICLG